MLEISLRSPHDLEPDPKNPRVHSDAQVRKIMRSMDRFGFVVPLLVHGGMIVAGHGRWLAAKQLGHVTVPCIELDGLTRREARAYMVADNQLGLESEWNYDMLRDVLPSIIELEIDPETIGFDEDEFDAIMSGFTPRGSQRAKPRNMSRQVAQITVICERGARERVVQVIEDAIEASRIGGVHVEG